MVGKEEAASFWLEPLTILIPILPEPPILPQKNKLWNHPPGNPFLTFLICHLYIYYICVHARDGPCGLMQ